MSVRLDIALRRFRILNHGEHREHGAGVFSRTESDVVFSVLSVLSVVQGFPLECSIDFTNRSNR
jgi:hypothetical protein